jgi:hypothetical protein
MDIIKLLIFILGEQHTVRLFEKRVLRRISESKIEKVTA